MSIATSTGSGGTTHELGPDSPERVAATSKGPVSLVISPNLDALLEHDERMRRAVQHGRSSSISALPDSPSQSLPPPPRRIRVPHSPSPLSPNSPRMSNDECASTPVSVESNPYINPAPQFIDYEPSSPPPISPPPRRSSMGIIGVTGTHGRVAVVNGVVAGPSLNDRSPTSSGTSSPSDSRYSPSVGASFRSPSLLRKSSPKGKEKGEPANSSKRSRGKLIKTREPSSPSQSQSPQTSQERDTMATRRPRSSRSISVSSAGRESFIDFDLFSPANQEFPDDLVGSFAAASPSPSSSSFPRPPKPPVPTTPKPDFSHLHTASVRRPPPVGPPPSVPIRAMQPNAMPPTTNFLNSTERTQLIKKSRKLAQVFGQTPASADIAADPSFLDISPAGTVESYHRPAVSINMVGQMPASARPLPPWPAPDKTIYMTVHGRRHSTPTTPITDAISDDGFLSTDLASDAPPSPRSFMDLSISNDDVGPDDSISVADTASLLSANVPRRRRPLIPPSLSSTSLSESFSLEEQAEEERRRRRDKLAKLHRFLGSRVPTNLVLGPGFADVPLPPPVVALDGTLAPGTADTGTDTVRARTWVKRRRSSSAAVLSMWSDDLDRLKENLNEKEKAIIVRRAQKMEKVFGVAPPQGLYSAHHNTSPTIPGTSSGAHRAPGSPAHTPPSSPVQRNPNQTPYKRSKGAGRRPKTGDSGEFLIAGAEPSAGSFVYTHYEHSLNSLHDIIDRNDHESLVELHHYLNDADADADPPPPSPPPTATLTSKAERRRSLPTLLPRASMASLMSVSTVASGASEMTVTTPNAAATEFQTRRRRAAKLTQFFGVDYHELIDEVLESIEAGLNAERRRGSLNPAEAESLLQKLRTLKTKRT